MAPKTKNPQEWDGPEQGSKESQRHVQAVVAALDVLDLFATAEKLRIKDLVQKTSYNKTKIMRLCGTLAAAGYLRYDRKNLSYSLGPRIKVLGDAYGNSNPIYLISKPILTELSNITRETCSLFVVDEPGRVCLVRVEGSEPIRFTLSEGTRNELFCGASGKVLLANADEDLRSRTFERLEKKNAAGETNLDIEMLKRDLTEIRKNGFAYSEGEISENLSALSCPVFNFDGTVCAAMAVTGPTFRFTEENRVFFLEKLRIAANRCSHHLGHEPAE